MHIDPVNLINSPQKYFNNSGLIKDVFKRLGAYIKCCHAKDTILRNELIFHVDEIVPGKGFLDYHTYLREISRLNEVPLIMEHMKRDEFAVGAAYIRKVATEEGLQI